MGRSCSFHLSFSPGLTKLDLTNVSLDGNTLEKVVLQLKGAPSLLILRLDGCHLGPGAATHLASLVGVSNCLLDTLSLSRNAIGDRISELSQVRLCLCTFPDVLSIFSCILLSTFTLLNLKPYVDLRQWRSTAPSGRQH